MQKKIFLNNLGFLSRKAKLLFSRGVLVQLPFKIMTNLLLCFYICEQAFCSPKIGKYIERRGAASMSRRAKKNRCEMKFELKEETILAAVVNVAK